MKNVPKVLKNTGKRKRLRDNKNMQSRDEDSLVARNYEEAQCTFEPKLEAKVDENVTPQKNVFQFMMNSRLKSNELSAVCAEPSQNGDNALEDDKGSRTKRGRLKNLGEGKDTSKRKRECKDSEQLEKSYDLKEVSDLKTNCSDDETVIIKRKRVSRPINSDSEVKEIKKDLEKNKRSWKLKIKLQNVGNLIDNILTKETTLDEVIVLENESESDVIEENKEPYNKEETIECCSTPEIVEIVEEVPIRRSLRSRKTVTVNYCTSSDDMEDVTVEKIKKAKKHSKVAPVFLKSLPKPKVDPKIAEAKRLFLLSGVPTVLRKELDKQQSLETDVQVSYFPHISHIQQKSEKHVLWTLEKPELKLLKQTEFDIQIPSLDFSTDMTSTESKIKDQYIRLSDVNNIKNIIKKIKAEHPEYPVFKIFNSLFNRSRMKDESNITNQTQFKSSPKRRGRKKKVSLSKIEPAIFDKENEAEEDLHSMWTEKYKAKNSSDIIGNSKAVLSLKTWLSKWSVSNNVKKAKYYSNSESEFESTDWDSRDSMKLLSNTIILKGPRSSGKSSTVYALCSELGFSVLEVNASSKRSGKMLLQQLQEATQSHQLGKKENILTTMKKEESAKSKMCVVLIEDLDLIFEQDEGFAAALQQIVTTSKRPIILTTTEDPSNGIKKIMDNYKVIDFSSLNSILTVWLQIVCLVEGCYFRLETLGHLIHFYEGDIRQVLLQLQFWISSSGYSNQIIDKDLKNDTIQNLRIHESTLENLDAVNYPIEVIWWNLPALLDVPNFSNLRLNSIEEFSTPVTHVINDSENNNINRLFDVFESLSTADLICRRHNRASKNLDRRWRARATESLLLQEQKHNYQNLIFERELTDFHISSSIKWYLQNSRRTNLLNINMAVPSLEEQKWFTKQSRYEENLEGALVDLDYLERKATSLDYMSTLRTIARSENKRAMVGMKRRNRFTHYLKELGVKGGDATYTWACNIFKSV